MLVWYTSNVTYISAMLNINPIVLNATESEGCLLWMIVLAIAIIAYLANNKDINKNKERKNYYDSSSKPIDFSYPKIDKKSASLPVKQSFQTQNYPANSSDIPRKPDWQRFQIIMGSNGIYALYHFTDESNLESIRAFGLYSWSACASNNISIPCPGGGTLSRDLDQKKGLHNYIHLSFNQNHPMAYVAKRDGRIQNPVYLSIDPSVIIWDTTLFSNQNAASTGAVIGGSINHFQSINFDIACGSRWNSDAEKAAFQAEVLIKEHIPAEFIRFPRVR